MNAKLFVSVNFALLCGVAGLRAGARSSADYSIPTDTIDAAGQNAQSTSYSLRGSAVGEFGAASPGSTSSASYTVRPGYVGQLSDLLTLAASRLTHNSAGTFDINLPLSGAAGVESRNSSIYTVVFTFANPLTGVAGVSATATGAIQPGPSSGSIDPSDPHYYIANLTALPNAQRVTVTLSNVNDSDGNSSSAIPAVMGLLVGDANGDGVVNSADATITRNLSGQTASATNFRADYNLDGSINAADATIVRARSGQSIPTSPAVLKAQSDKETKTQFP